MVCPFGRPSTKPARRVGERVSDFGFDQQGPYAWQLTDNAKFTQGVSVFGAEDTTLNSESALNVAINEHFGLKVAYNVTWNSEPPESAPEHTDRRTTLSLGYSM
ncbi:DUF481 domain-containing protein [Escherichia coli]|nr:DUF481 domain-containing protein [Escherichia coli]